MTGESIKSRNDLFQREIKEAVLSTARSILRKNGSLNEAKEDKPFRPELIKQLSRLGYECQNTPTTLSTKVRPHPFDLIWSKDGVSGAIELKLKSKIRNHPVDDARLFFWYDIKWLELGIEFGSFQLGTAILLTDLNQLYEESGKGDWRHDYYRIGHLNAHRCNDDKPDHLFKKKYKPETQFLSELHPLHIKGCYDFRDKWHEFESHKTFLLTVPITS